MNVLFVCTGNTCRSIMAEAYLKSLSVSGVNALSRGICADGSPVSPNAVRVLAEAGITAPKGFSEQITDDDIKNSDKIICLSAEHISALLNCGAQKEMLCLLAGGVPDPYGGSIEEYRECFKKIKDKIDVLVNTGFFNSYTVVPLDHLHLQAIAKLEKICFSEPWSADGIAESYKTGTKFFVAECGGRVLGYAGIKPVLDEGYITNIAVFPKHRNNGVATALIKRIFSFARDNALSFVSLEVRESNLAAISLYNKFGFKTEGRRRDFYRDPCEDALIMTKRFKTDEDTCD